MAYYAVWASLIVVRSPIVVTFCVIWSLMEISLIDNHATSSFLYLTAINGMWTIYADVEAAIPKSAILATVCSLLYIWVICETPCSQVANTNSRGLVMPLNTRIPYL